MLMPSEPFYYRFPCLLSTPLSESCWSRLNLFCLSSDCPQSWVSSPQYEHREKEAEVWLIAIYLCTPETRLAHSWLGCPCIWSPSRFSHTFPDCWDLLTSTAFVQLIPLVIRLQPEWGGRILSCAGLPCAASKEQRLLLINKDTFWALSGLMHSGDWLSKEHIFSPIPGQ